MVTDERNIKKILEDLHYNRNMSQSKIAVYLGKSRPTISRLFKVYKINTKHCSESYIPFKKYGFKSAGDLKQALISWYRNGLSQQKISEVIGCTRPTVVNLFKLFGIKTKTNLEKRFGDENELREYVIKCHKKESISKIAKKLGVCTQTIKSILK